jgi:hypothetical protein
MTFEQYAIKMTKKMRKRQQINIVAKLKDQYMVLTVPLRTRVSSSMGLAPAVFGPGTEKFITVISKGHIQFDYQGLKESWLKSREAWNSSTVLERVANSFKG